MKKLIAPSILAADFGNLQRDIEMLNNSAADWIHCDIMDANFVPNISFGFPVLDAVKKHAQKPMDIHLMMLDPDRYLERFKDSGAANITVHYEACTHLHRTIQKIKALDIMASVSLNPHTPVELLEDIIDDVDMVLLMTVNPGYGGQKFIKNSYDRIRRCKTMIEKKSTPTRIEVDGGVSTANAKALCEAGVDVLVAGSFVFNADDPVATIQTLKEI